MNPGRQERPIANSQDIRWVLPGQESSSRPGLVRNAWFVDDSLVTKSDSVRDKNSFHSAVKYVLVIAECFGLMPVIGICGENATSLRFRWRSLRVAYSLLVIFCVFLLAAFWMWKLIGDGLHFTFITAVVFYVTCLVNMVLFLRLATQWPELMVTLHRVELSLKTPYGYPKRLARSVGLAAGIVLPAALAEHFLSIYRDLKLSVICSGGSIEFVRIYLLNFYAAIFEVFPFSYGMGISLFLVDNVATFAWNYMDLFVMIVSMMLVQRFRQVNRRIDAVINQSLPSSFWRQSREDYGTLCRVVELVDSRINKILLLSFWNNVYFVCLQLYHSLMWRQKLEDFLYFYLSLGYLLVRATAVCLFAASVNEESKRPSVCLYSVPSDSYCNEVHRFIVHMTGGEIALTALNFFAITRGLLLTLVGTIITYEMLMVQLNEDHRMEMDNSTAPMVNISVNPFCPDLVLDAEGWPTRGGDY